MSSKNNVIVKKNAGKKPVEKTTAKVVNKTAKKTVVKKERVSVKKGSVPANKPAGVKKTAKPNKTAATPVKKAVSTKQREPAKKTNAMGKLIFKALTFNKKASSELPENEYLAKLNSFYETYKVYSEGKATRGVIDLQRLNRKHDHARHDLITVIRKAEKDGSFSPKKVAKKCRDILALGGVSSDVTVPVRNFLTKIEADKKFDIKEAIVALGDLKDSCLKIMADASKKAEDKRWFLIKVKEAQDGNLLSRDEIIERILPIAKKTAQKYAYMTDETLFDDLFQSAMMSSMKGISRFDCKKSDNFLQYATLWLSQGILSYITNKSHAIRLPAHVRHQLKKINDYLAQNTGAQGGKKMDISDAAKELGIDEDRAKDIVSHGNVNRVVYFSEMESESDEGDRMGIENSLSIADKSDITRDLVKNEDVNELKNAILQVLNEEERQILVYRFGLFDTAPLLLKDLGMMFKKSEERIRQIENKALQKLSVKFFDRKNMMMGIKRRG